MINEHSNFKEEGRAGLAYAYDDHGIYTSAENAERGKQYRCPICDCPMHLTRTKRGKLFFARIPGQVHTNIACITKERRGQERSFEGLDPERFIASLCYVSPRNARPRNPIDVDGNTDHQNGDMPTTKDVDDDFSLRKFENLKQIAESGVEHLNANDMQGGHKVSEFLMTYRYAGYFFGNPNFKLGARIVYARYAFYDAKGQALVFTLYTKQLSVKFRVEFLKRSDFRRYREKFGEFMVSENNKTVFRKKTHNQDVLIASDKWIFIEKSRCRDICSSNEKYCKSCSGMYCARFTSSKQIYIIPGDH